MISNWQDILALGLVLAAALYMGWRGLRLVRSRGRCGGCHICSGKEEPGSGGELPLVDIRTVGGTSQPAGKAGPGR